MSNQENFELESMDQYSSQESSSSYSSGVYSQCSDSEFYFNSAENYAPLYNPVYLNGDYGIFGTENHTMITENTMFYSSFQTNVNDVESQQLEKFISGSDQVSMQSSPAHFNSFPSDFKSPFTSSPNKGRKLKIEPKWQFGNVSNPIPATAADQTSLSKMLNITSIEPNLSLNKIYPVKLSESSKFENLSNSVTVVSNQNKMQNDSPIETSSSPFNVGINHESFGGSSFTSSMSSTELDKKLMQKRERNRIAARKCRDKKLNKIKEYETRISELQSEISGHESDILKLSARKNELRLMLVNYCYNKMNNSISSI